MKATVIKLTALILAGTAMARAEASVIKIQADEPTYLYGAQASSWKVTSRSKPEINFAGGAAGI